MVRWWVAGSLSPSSSLVGKYKPKASLNFIFFKRPKKKGNVLGVGWEQGRDWRDINEVLKRDPLSIPIHTIFAGQYGAVFTQGRGSGWAHSHYNSHTGNAPCVQWLLLCFSVGGGGGSQRAQPQRNVVSRSRNVDSRVCSRRLRLPLIFFFFAKEKGRVGSHTHADTENKETNNINNKSKNKGGGILASTRSSFQSQLMSGI